ncbi:MAG: FkbM family methyltransferase [Alphaproteobacteria bacterium]
MTAPALTPRQRLSRLAHLWKAATQRHHAGMAPWLARHIPPDATVIDAGAHAGQFAKLFARLAPQGEVWAFEPAAYARSILGPALRLSGARNVRIVAAGLSDAPGTATLETPLKRRGSLGFGLAGIGAATARGDAGRAETIAITTLDAFAAAEGLSRLDFLKADVEGWEIRLLAGGRDTLARFRPALLLELVGASLARAGDRPGDAWALLSPLGYRARKLVDEQPRADWLDEFAGDADYLFVAEKQEG